MKRSMLFASRAIAGATMLLSAVSAAGAQTITFGGLTGANGSAFTTYSESGYDVSLTVGYLCEAHNFGNPTPDLFGGPVCNSGIPDGQLTVVRNGGGLFRFAGLEIAANNGTVDYSINGFMGNSNQFGFLGQASTGSVFNTYGGGSAGADIDFLRITLFNTQGSSYNIDNINVTAARTVVPEPASFVLLGAGLVGVALARRKRRA